MTQEEEIQKLLNEGEIIKAEHKIHSLREQNANMLIIDCMIRVFYVEVEKNCQNTVFDYSVDIQKLAEHFIKLKLLLRRLEFDLPKNKQKELYDYCIENHVSEYLLVFILLNNIFDKKKVCRQLIDLFEEKEYFKQTYQYLEEKENG